MAHEPPRQGHIPALDGVRALAVLMVVLHHSVRFKEPEGVVEQAVLTIATTGWIGVDLFFVLSGFLITGILLEQQDAPNRWRAFLWRRVVRIFPLYYAFLFLLFVVMPAFGSHRFCPGPTARLSHWLYLSNYWIAQQGWSPRVPNHLWSLAIEEQFYLLWPVVVWALGAAGLRRLVVAMLLLTPFVRWGLAYVGTPYVALYTMTHTRWDGLAVGALVALAMRSPGGLTAWRGHAQAMAAACFGTMALWAYTLNGVSPESTSWWHQGPLYSVITWGFGAALVLLLTAPPDHLAQRMMRARWLAQIGTYSYAVYVLHPVVVYGLRVAHLAPGQRALRDSATFVPMLLLHFVVVTALTLVAAWVSWHLLEKRFLALKDRVPYRPDPA